MSTTTFVHLPSDGEPFEVPTLVIDKPESAVLMVTVPGDFYLHIHASIPAHLRAIATAAATLADRLEARQIIAAHASPIVASEVNTPGPPAGLVPSDATPEQVTTT